MTLMVMEECSKCREMFYTAKQYVQWNPHVCSTCQKKEQESNRIRDKFKALKKKNSRIRLRI